jgi:nucleotide-binding universal stress UspA family protein
MDERQPVIVCGVDGSSAGDRALRWAIDDAVRRSGAVRAVTAWSWDGLEDFGAASTAAEAFERARRVLDASVDRAIDTTEDPPVIERICQRGTPSDALCDAAVDAELLVLGSHGHGTAHDKLVGSTSERAVHRAPCPIVIVPEPRHAERNLERAQARRRRWEPPHPMQVV